MADRYREQVILLLRILPSVAREEVFGLKGGTAINLFERNLPRLSVDIDLTYLPFDDRETATEPLPSSAPKRPRGASACAVGPNPVPKNDPASSVLHTKTESYKR